MFSPMTKSLADYILNPILIIISFCLEHDFYHNHIYFLLNLIISLVIVLCGLVYNEILVLFCWDLEYETHQQVSIRGENMEREMKERFQTLDSFYNEGLSSSNKYNISYLSNIGSD